MLCGLLALLVVSSSALSADVPEVGDWANVMLQEARTRADEGKTLEAIDMLEGLVAADPSLTAPKFALARMYSELGWWEDAAVMLSGVTAAHPNHQSAWLMLGQTHERLCNWQAAPCSPGRGRSVRLGGGRPYRVHTYLPPGA